MIYSCNNLKKYYISHLEYRLNWILPMKMINYPDKINKIFNTLNKHSIKSIIVGGYVRDQLLNINSKDMDIELYDISSFEYLENILKIFGDINTVGKSFGVCKLKYDAYDLDFSLPRRDSKVAKGYTGFEVQIDSKLDFKTASTRRDFTINAIGYDVINKKILDPHNGLRDLEIKILRAVDNKTFTQDPLRILRAVQLSARLEFSLDKKLFLLCQDIVKQNILEELPKERIYEEIKKLLLKSKKPSIGFKLLKSLNALRYFKPLDKIDKKNWLDFLNNIDKVNKIAGFDTKTKEILSLATICKIFSINDTKMFILNLTNDKEILSRILNLLETLPELEKINNDLKNDYLIYKLATKVNIKEVLVLSEVFFGFSDNIRKKAKDLNIFTIKMPALIQGKDLISLGLKPSKEFSAILETAYEAQMHKKFNSHAQAINWLKTAILNIS